MVSIMKKYMKTAPQNDSTPTVMKIYPIFSSPIDLTRFGVIKLITKLTIQLRTVATLYDLSCMISAMYNHVIGPDENSKKAMNTITSVTDGIV